MWIRLWWKYHGRLLFDSITDKVYYIDNHYHNKINVYKNYENFKLKQCEIQLELPSQISASYSVIHRGFFYYFIDNTNNLVKYDLNKKKNIINKKILPDAALDNQNQWGGNKNINLISDDNNLYAVYSSNNNNKRISIGLLDGNTLNVIKIWNTDSLERKKCGPIFMIKNRLYHINSCSNQNDSVVYSYDLDTEKSNKIIIPFQNLGGYDSSLTYYSHNNCLMTVNKRKIYKYKVILENKIKN